MAKINLFLQARMSSERLPGKVLLPLADFSVLELQIRRLSHTKRINELIVLTSTNPEDDSIIEECKKLDVPFFRGSLDDVLSRFVKALETFPCDHLIRCTADNPLNDSRIIDELIEQYYSDRCEVEYMTTPHDRCVPRGTGGEIFTAEAIHRCARLTTDPVDREHVTRFIQHNPSLFKPKKMRLSDPYPECRLTLDTPSDYERLKKICNHFQEECLTVEVRNIIDWLNSPR